MTDMIQWQRASRTLISSLSLHEIHVADICCSCNVRSWLRKQASGVSGSKAKAYCRFLLSRASVRRSSQTSRENVYTIQIPRYSTIACQNWSELLLPSRVYAVIYFTPRLCRIGLKCGVELSLTWQTFIHLAYSACHLRRPTPEQTQHSR